MAKKVGILAVQGDYEAHGRMLERLGVTPVFVRRPADLEGLHGLILPGGESTTILKFLQEEGLFEAVQRFSREGGAIFGTCAGVILLARSVKNPVQDSLGLADLTAIRNGYGRQLQSNVRSGDSSIGKLEMVFIRAPRIEAVGPRVQVLAEVEDSPVLVQQDKILCCTFHPELTDDATVHRHFLSLVPNGN